jgi:hypothetical protein
MPVIYGKMYPEIELAGPLNYRFKVLIDADAKSQELSTFIAEVCTLKSYLNDIVDNRVSIELYITPTNNLDDYTIFPLTPLPLNKDISDYNESIKTLSQKIDADLIVTKNNGLREFINTKKDLNFVAVNFNDAKKGLEIFVRGHEIPWAFADPVWNMPWTNFYGMSDEFGRKSFEVYANNLIKAGLDSEAVELGRSLLLNRVPNICYTRDKLLFYVQQRRYAKRHSWKRQDFAFESSYYLCHYYLLLWGGVDQLARILNKALKLGITHFSSIDLSKPKFVDKIASMDQNLGRLYKEDAFVKWIEQLKKNRHYTAHEGSIILSSFVEEPESEPSDEELEKEIRADPVWNRILNKAKMRLPKEMFEAYRASVIQTKRISKYKELADDVMVIQNGTTKYLFRPLVNIEWDFNNFKLITLKTLDALHEWVQTRQK